VRFRLLLISGSLRHRSTSTAALLTAYHLAPPGVEASVYCGLAGLPAFNPDDDGDRMPAAVADLRDGIHDADAIMFSTPEYAGALPGSLKNLLDWTIGDDQSRSIYQKPVAWINASPRGAGGAHQELRTVLGYASAQIVEAACLDLPVTNAMIDEAGLIADPLARRRILDSVCTLSGHRDIGMKNSEA
jgi:chromate reductase, NAD(P)H dehydrogenase (quinone)